MSAKWGPTGVAAAVNTARLRLPEEPAYIWGDKLACCGCVVHSGAETGPCECRCHWAARLAAKPEFVKVGAKR